MVRKATFAFGALVWLAAAEHARAEQLRLTMREAVARAIASNTDLRRSSTDIDSARSELHASRALLPGNPYVTGGIQRMVERKFGPNYGFSVSQEFEIAGQRGKRISVAESTVRKALADRDSAEAAVVAAVKTAFVRARTAAERAALARQGAGAAEALAGARPRRLQGDLARIDENVARVQLSRAAREVAAAEHAHEDAMSSLSHLLDLGPDQSVELAGGLLVPPLTIQPLAELIDAATQRRPDLHAMRLQAERAERQLALARREAIPNVVVSATVSRFEEDTFAGGDLGVSLPIFRPNNPAHREAAFDNERAARIARDAERQVERDVRQAWRACAQTAADLRRLAEEIVPKSEENLAIERRLYERGEVGLSDLVGLQYDALLARREYIDAVGVYNESLVELERATGGAFEYHLTK